MLLETNLTYQIANYQEDSDISGKILFERLLYSRKCIEMPSCALQLDEYASLSEELCEAALYLDESLTARQLSSRYKFTGLILEDSGRYTEDYLNAMSAEEINNLLLIMYKLPNEAIDDIFEYHTYRRQPKSKSLYNNIKPFKLEQYRISDHWNVAVKGQIVGRTAGKKPRHGEFCVGEKINDKQWKIVKSYGYKVTRSDAQKKEIISKIIDSNLFAKNKEATEQLYLIKQEL